MDAIQTIAIAKLIGESAEVDNSGKVQTKAFDGRHFHHDISRLEMDLRWRGRIDKAGNATLLPPIRLYAGFSAEDIPLPRQNPVRSGEDGGKAVLYRHGKGVEELGKNQRSKEIASGAISAIQDAST